MPQITAFGWACWLASIAGELALSVLLIRRKVYLRWRAVCVFVWFRAAVNLFLLATYLEVWGYDRTPSVYFHGYWTCMAVSGALQVWIVTEIGCNLAPTVGRVLQRIIPATAVLYLISAYLLLRGTSMPFVRRETQLAVDLSRAASISWLIEFVCLLYASDFLGISWRRQDIGVATGFTIQAAGDTGVSWLLNILPTKWAHLSNVQCVIWMFALSWWAVTFLRPDDDAVEAVNVHRLSAAAKRIYQALGVSKK